MSDARPTPEEVMVNSAHKTIGLTTSIDVARRQLQDLASARYLVIELPARTYPPGVAYQDILRRAVEHLDANTPLGNAWVRSLVKGLITNTITALDESAPAEVASP